MRNIAIIAHVDHGKTTLVDKILTESGTLSAASGERVMDSDNLEKERGITIMAKNTAIMWGGYQINIVDTPGHSDFGGEVERILGMVDGVVLLVDVLEGPMTQTKFVLSKALKKELPTIVVLNKMDRDSAARSKTESDIFDLFMELGASEDLLNYPTLYASGKSGWVIADPDAPQQGMNDLLKAVIDHVPAPKVDRNDVFRMLVTTLDYDEHLGKLLVGRVQSGSVKAGDTIKALSYDNKKLEEGTVTKVLSKNGLVNEVIPKGLAGDIVAVAGFNSNVSSTLCDPSVAEPLHADPIDPPVLSMTFGVNSSPLAGKEGKIFSALHIKERLERETQRNVTITTSTHAERTEEVVVSGRGELQLSILIENMRREGFELSISPPQVIMIKGEDNETLEPMEEVIIDVDNEYSGMVLDMMRMRDADLQQMEQGASKTRAVFHATSRSLIGLRSDIANATRGMAVFNHLFHSYVDFEPSQLQIRKGVMVSMAEGQASSYALKPLESRGPLFIGPQAKVYEGMIVGENAKAGDLDVNPVKSKQLTNFRAAGKDENYKLIPPRRMNLEEAIAYVQEDELIEVTPHNIRLRKKILESGARQRAAKKAKTGN
eukprot:CAMPEP_0117033446 /NCGR_PEP_ID=MMETSP0472-20121206/23896_1 /TAXON_ID=693140 ORGANISM="Tiarina fusus, Strain LIS" /NCGR_SAMPLE_ID=MMETSP0472 /ASSEMBLY_ACC=CAM_ASM_000603 /LENGTH=602 /DNA_ID=CAMNT_0004742363 /DNA_START=221 /DNA_END=2029 /DNA_ORIENTATION=+